MMTSVLVKKARDAARLRELSALDESKVSGGFFSQGCGSCSPGFSWVSDPCPQCPGGEQGYCGDTC